MEALFLTVVLFCGIPLDNVAVDRVDVTEINHFYNEKGGVVLDQVIYWNYNELYHDYEVVAWRMIKDGREELTAEELKQREKTQMVIQTLPDGTVIKTPVVPRFIGSYLVPVKIKEGLYKATWLDDDTMRTVYSKSVRETWTQYDPELVNRNVLKQKYRKGLLDHKKIWRELERSRRTIPRTIEEEIEEVLDRLRMKP